MNSLLIEMAVFDTLLSAFLIVLGAALHRWGGAVCVVGALLGVFFYNIIFYLWL
jgi:hypothetical protein